MPPALVCREPGTAASGKLSLRGLSRASLSESTSRPLKMLCKPLKRMEEFRVTATGTGLYQLATHEGALSSPRLLELHRQLKALANLQEGWDSYDAAPPNAMAMENARRALDVFLSPERGVLPDRISASVEGGVGFVFRTKGRYADVEFFNTGEIASAASKEDGRSDVSEWSDNETADMIDWIRERIE